MGQSIHTYEDIKKLNSGNQILGKFPTLSNSTITFQGENNILYCEDNVKLVNSEIIFNGSNSIVWLGSSNHQYKVSISINFNSVCHIGRNNYMNGILHIIVSEQKHVYIGNDCLFSFGIWIRNADPHLIYDIESKNRINPTKSIFIGDHVWLGQSVMILKGTNIGSGSIIGAMSVIGNKNVPSNVSYGGNPAKLIKQNVFWEGSCVHKWTEKETLDNQIFKGDSYIYIYIQEKEQLQFDKIDSTFSEYDMDMKMRYLLELENKGKNRFYIKIMKNNSRTNNKRNIFTIIKYLKQ